jgi:hypothetical protein
MGSYRVPDWKKSVEQNKFEVELDGQTFSLPKAEYLTGSQAERMSRVEEIEGGMYTVLDEICPGLGAAFRDVPAKFFGEFLEAWQKDSSVEPGESSPSSSS